MRIPERASDRGSRPKSIARISQNLNHVIHIVLPLELADETQPRHTTSGKPRDLRCLGITQFAYPFSLKAAELLRVQPRFLHALGRRRGRGRGRGRGARRVPVLETRSSILESRDSIIPVDSSTTIAAAPSLARTASARAPAALSWPTANTNGDCGNSEPIFFARAVVL